MPKNVKLKQKETINNKSLVPELSIIPRCQIEVILCSLTSNLEFSLDKISIMPFRCILAVNGECPFWVSLGKTNSTIILLMNTLFY